MKVRIITAVVALAILLPILIFSDTILFPLAMAVLSFVGALEMLRAWGYLHHFAVSIPALGLSAALPLLVYFLPFARRYELMLIFLAAYAALMCYWFTYAVLRGGKEKFSDLSACYVALSYITAGFCSLGLLRSAPAGVYLFLIPMIGAWLTDTFAYFSGMLFGRHKLCPTLSPKKTVEGAIGGTVGGVASVVVFGVIVGAVTEFRANILSLILCGLAVSVLSQIGVLIASLIKRERGIKDYGRVFPGHGGVLDRFDSVIATSIVTYVICLLPASAAVLA